MGKGITRREFGIAGLALAVGGTSARADVLGPQPLVVDSSTDCTKVAKALADKGTKVLMRYYSWPGYVNTMLTAREAHAIHGSGMAIGLAYQFNSRNLARFDQANAKAAADACLDMDRDLTRKTGRDKANTLNHPDGTVIYFGVDGDLVTHLDPKQRQRNTDVIRGFFNTVQSAFKDRKAPFLMGIYGAGELAEKLHTEGLVEKIWLPAAATSWAGTRDLYNKPGRDHWHLAQYALEIPLVPAAGKLGLVDSNILNPNTDGLIGAFDANGLIGPLNDSNVRSKLRFVMPAAGSRMLKSVGGPALGHIAQGRMVTLLEDGQTWSKVEYGFGDKKEGNPSVMQHGVLPTKELGDIARMPPL
jgi:Domain of unknown function (DUF1906)